MRGRSSETFRPQGRFPLNENTMQPVLNYTRVASIEEPGSWLYLLHGIYGSGRNWGSVARRLVEERPEWGVILVDLRLHGGSLGFQPPHTIAACSADLLRLQDELRLPAAGLLGHSFGGKVALFHAGENPDNLRQVWVVDSTLRTGEPAGMPWNILGIVRSLPERFATREQLADAMVEHGYARPVGQWLAMNLERDEGVFRWRIDWDGVEEMLRDYFVTDVWDTITEPPEQLEINVVRAMKSDAVDAEARARIGEAAERTRRVHLHEVVGGHWLNIDNADAVLKLLAEHLPDA